MHKFLRVRRKTVYDLTVSRISVLKFLQNPLKFCILENKLPSSSCFMVAM